MKHTLWYKEGNRLDYKPVHVAAVRRDDATESQDLLMKLSIYRYDPDKDEKP
jgi:hypothetical protein